MPKIPPMLSLSETNRALHDTSRQMNEFNRKTLLKLETYVRTARTPRQLDRAINNMNKRALRAAGAAVMGVARGSMKPPPKGQRGDRNIAQANHPPRVHVNHGLKKGPQAVQFRLLPGGMRPRAVVIGPSLRSRPRAARALEYGGMAPYETKTRINPKTGRPIESYDENGNRIHHGSPRPNMGPGARSRIKAYYKTLKVIKRNKQVRRRPFPFMRPAMRRAIFRNRGGGGAARWWHRKLTRVA